MKEVEGKEGPDWKVRGRVALEWGGQLFGAVRAGTREGGKREGNVHIFFGHGNHSQEEGWSRGVTLKGEIKTRSHRRKKNRGTSVGGVWGGTLTPGGKNIGLRSKATLERVKIKKFLVGKKLAVGRYRVWT